MFSTSGTGGLVKKQGWWLLKAPAGYWFAGGWWNGCSFTHDLCLAAESWLSGLFTL